MTVNRHFSWWILLDCNVGFLALLVSSVSFFWKGHELQGVTEYSESRTSVVSISEEFVTETVSASSAWNLQSIRSSIFRDFCQRILMDRLLKSRPRGVMIVFRKARKHFVVAFDADINTALEMISVMFFTFPSAKSHNEGFNGGDEIIFYIKGKTWSTAGTCLGKPPFDSLELIIF